MSCYQKSVEVLDEGISERRSRGEGIPEGREGREIEHITDALMLIASMMAHLIDGHEADQ